MVAWPGGEVRVPFGIPDRQVLHLAFAPRPGGGLLGVALAEGLAVLTLLVFDEDFTWRQVEVDPRGAPVVGLQVVGTQDTADGELAHVIFATPDRLTRCRVVLATGEQRRDELGVD